jgi:hypothetical protein
MTCAELLRRLDADEPLDVAEVREHAASCASCRAALARWRAAAGELRRWHEEPAPPFLHGRIMTSLRAARARRPWWAVLVSGPRPAWALSALATVFVAVIGGLVVWHGRGSLEQGAAPSAPEADSRDKDLSYARRSGPAEAPPAGSEPASTLRATLAPQATPATPPLQGRLDKLDRLGEREAEAPAAPPPAPPPAKGELEEKRWRDGETSGLADQPSAGGYAPEPPRPAAPAGSPRGASRPQAESVRLAEEHVKKAEGAGERALGELRQDSATSSSLGLAGKPSATLRCVVTPLDGSPTRTVSLPAAGPPGAGETWEILVDAEGRVRTAVRLEDETDLGGTVPGRAQTRSGKARAKQAPPFNDEARRAIHDLALPQGRYHVEREE